MDKYKLGRWKTPAERKVGAKRALEICDEHVAQIPVNRREIKPPLDVAPPTGVDSATAEKSLKKGLVKDRTGIYSDRQSRAANDDTLLPDKK